MSDQARKLLFFAIVGLVVWQVLLGGKLPIGPVTPAAPFKTDKLAVLVVEESSDGDTPVWVRGTSATSVKAAVEKAGGEYRVLDHHDAVDKLAPHWQEAMAAAKGKTLPWMVAADKAAGFSQPVTTQAAAMQSLKSLGVK